MDKPISSGSLIFDDILINILSRVSIKEVLRCKCVSKNWRQLTSTIKFSELQLPWQCLPTILCRNNSVCSIKEFIDNWWELERAMLKVHRFKIPHKCKILFSQEGLLVLKYQADFVILNPVNDDEVRIIPSEKQGEIIVSGIFWSSNLKEHCVMFAYSHSFEFKNLNLGPKPCLRKIQNPWKDKITVFKYADPVMVGDYLYRIVEGEYDEKILKFNVKSEEFTLIQHPVDFRINILNIDGHLSVVRVEAEVNLITVIKWALMDRVKHVWIRSCYSIRCEFCPSPSRGTLAIAYAAGILLVKHDQTLFVCDHKRETEKKFGRMQYNNVDLFVPHVMSLASLRDCKSEIVID